MDIDCNICINLNITEHEQNNSKDKPQHKCKFYNIKVIHRSNSQDHNSKIYPCSQCESDNYINFK